MAQLYDQQSGQVVDVPDEDATQAIASGQFLPPKGKVNVISANGEPQAIDAQDAQEAFTKYGYRLEHAQETAQRKYGDRELGAAGAAALRGATFGLSDVALSKAGLVDREALKGMEMANPGASAAGEVGGVLASLLIPGEGEANAAKFVGKLGQLAEKGTAKAVGSGLLGRLASKGVGAAVEGSFYGAGRAVSEAALDDQQLTAEKLLAGAGVGALVGLGGGVATGAAGEVASKGLQLAKKAVGGTNLGEALEEFAADRAAKAAGAERGTINKLRSPEQAKEIGQDLLDLGIVSGGKSQEEIRAGVRTALKEKGQAIGETLRAADEASGGKAFDLSGFLAKARSDVVDDLASDPVLAPKAKKLERMLDRFETQAEDGVSFAQANKWKGSLQKEVKKWAASDAKLEANKKLQGILDDEIERQLSERGADLSAFQETKRLYGSLKEASKWGKNQAAAGGGNGLFGLRDVIMGAAGLGHGGPAGVALALGSKVARERGNQVLADIANRVANSETLQRVAGSFQKSVSSALEKSPEAFGPYSGMLANAAARSAGDLYATHALLSQADAGYANAMAQAGYAPESPEEHMAAVRRVESLNAIQRAVRAHDDAVTQSIQGFLKNQSNAREGRDRVEKRATLEHIAQQLQQIVGNPQAMADRMRLGSTLADDAPGTGAALAMTATRAVQFLHDKSPQNPNPGLVKALEKPWKPTDSQLDMFGRYVEAVNNPATVLEDLRRGSVSKEAVEALQAVYPKLADDIRARLTTHLADTQQRLTYRQRSALAPILGDQIALSPGAQAVLSQAHQSAQAHEAARQSTPPVAAQKRLQATTQTQSQRIETRGAA